MLEKINSKRFEKETISLEDQHQLRGGAQEFICTFPTDVCLTTCAVWEDCGTVSDDHKDGLLPAANNISSR